jgi:hypothetical protein
VLLYPTNYLKKNYAEEYMETIYSTFEYGSLSPAAFGQEKACMRVYINYLFVPDPTTLTNGRNKILFLRK